MIETVGSCNSFCSTIIDLVATVQMLKNIFPGCCCPWFTKALHTMKSMDQEIEVSVMSPRFEGPFSNADTVYC